MLIRKNMDTSITASGPQRIVRGLGLLGMVLIIGTMGYMLLEKWYLLDALYMTVITITTVGFKEVRTVSEPGRIFTVVLIFMGMGIMAYTLGMAAQFMVEGEIRSILGRRKLGSRIKSLKKHYIICGYGRIGRIIAQELKSKGIPILVIDSDPESQSALDHHDMPYIIDDATSEEVLIEAGIERAKGLIAVVLSDADNLFITMTARGLKPDLFILARADEEHAQKKLLRAGADHVVLPYLMGGRKMAQTILRPAVADFLDLTIHDKDIELNMEGLQVKEVSKLNGITLIDSGIRQKMNVIVVAIRKSDGEMMFNPCSEACIEAGDTLIALGQSSELDRLASILAGK